MATILGMFLEAPPHDALGFEIGFKVADVDAAVNELIVAASRRGAPTDSLWGQRTAYVRDPTAISSIWRQAPGRNFRSAAI